MEFDEMNFQDEIELMNIERQTKQSYTENKETLGFNSDALYNAIENK
ncbi:MAG: hypothetical protein K2H53_03070 [Clostridia bacterium]|nr:hypothetical protein [Clostridia bacterium]